MNGLCSKCKSFKVDKALYRIKNCPTENSLVAFSHNHKVEAIIVSCKEFLLLPYPRKVEVMPGREFENDVMKEEKKETLIYNPSEEEEGREEQQEVKEKGGNDADHRTQ